MLPLQLWRNRVVTVGCLAGLFNGALMMTISGFLPTYVQGAMGRDAIASGVVLAASYEARAFGYDESVAEIERSASHLRPLIKRTATGS